MKITEHGIVLEGDAYRVKVIAEAIAEYMDKHRIDDTTLGDFRYNIEIAYQEYYGLDKDNWDYADEAEYNNDAYRKGDIK